MKYARSPEIVVSNVLRKSYVVSKNIDEQPSFQRLGDIPKARTGIPDVLL